MRNHSACTLYAGEALTNIQLIPNRVNSGRVDITILYLDDTIAPEAPRLDVVRLQKDGKDGKTLYQLLLDRCGHGGRYYYSFPRLSPGRYSLRLSAYISGLVGNMWENDAVLEVV